MQSNFLTGNDNGFFQCAFHFKSSQCDDSAVVLVFFSRRTERKARPDRNRCPHWNSRGKAAGRVPSAEASNRKNLGGHFQVAFLRSRPPSLLIAPKWLR